MLIDKVLASLKGVGTPQCESWREKILLRHAAIAHHLGKEYLRINAADGHPAANQWLLITTKTLKLGRTGLSLTGSIKELQQYCKVKAQKTHLQIHEIFQSVGKEAAPEIIRQLVEHTGVTFPVGAEYTQDEIIAALARVVDPRWWKSQLRAKQWREMEDFLRSLGGVTKNKEIYISDCSLHR